MGRIVGGLAACLLLSGCSPSEHPADLKVVAHVEGAGQHLDGTPVKGGEVAVMREVAVGDAALGDSLPRRIGPICLTGNELSGACERFGNMSDLDGKGRFRVGLTRDEVKTRLTGDPAIVWATVAAPSRGSVRWGAATSYAFQVGDKKSFEVPALRVWEPQVRVTQQRGSVAVAPVALPEELGEPGAADVVFNAADGTPVWRTSQEAGAVDVRVLEDVRAGAALEVTATGTGALDAEVVYRSAYRRVKGPGRPPSRGVGCRVVAPGLRDVTYEQCGVTDGDFTVPVDPETDAAEARCTKRQKRKTKRCPRDRLAREAALIVDLGAPRDLHLIVLRAEEQDLVVSASTNGKRWLPVGESHTTGGQGLLEPRVGSRARYLRLEGKGEVGLATLREVSIW